MSSLVLAWVAPRGLQWGGSDPSLSFRARSTALAAWVEHRTPSLLSGKVSSLSLSFRSRVLCSTQLRLGRRQLHLRCKRTSPAKAEKVNSHFTGSYWWMWAGRGVIFLPRKSSSRPLGLPCFALFDSPTLRVNLGWNYLTGWKPLSKRGDSLFICCQSRLGVQTSNPVVERWVCRCRPQDFLCRRLMVEGLE